MISFRRKKASADLIDSRLFDECSFYDQFVKDLKKAKKSVVIESPYLTEKRAIYFLKIFKKLNKRGVKAKINTREPKHHCKNLEIQAWKAINILRQGGVEIYLCSDMRHRKLAMIDGSILWEGSLNILSQARSREIMRRTESRKLCKQMIKFTKVNNRF